MQYPLEVGRFLREIWAERINPSSNCAERLGFFWILENLKQIFGDSHEIDFLRMTYSSNGETGFIF